MLKILSLANLLPNIISGVFGYLNKKEDSSLEKYRVDGVVNVEAMRQDTAIIQARAELAKAMKDDPSTKIGRWLIIIPTGLWYSAIIVYCIFHNAFPEYTWQILALPPNLNYIPYAVVAYLLVTAWSGSGRK